ncbi:class I adenylate-forming enzyme family protein [Streptomyces sp. URMC 123]|uniref:class I adenylate-forming enzyme family protein n=1 Tax=Streptomyces sp. URMC 123 TaxID=3423403 RepID=UPI003F1D69B8
MGRLTIGQRIEQLAVAQPEATALVVLDRRGGESRVGWAELDERANHCAAVLAGHGVRTGDPVVVALPPGADHVIATVGAWKLGATVVPLDPRLPAGEARALTDAIRPRLRVGAPLPGAPCPALSPEECGSGRRPRPPEGEWGTPRSASATGGTTGLPRIIHRRRGWVFDTDALPAAHERAVGLDTGQVQLVTVPLFHSGFGALYQGLALAHTVVLTPRFMPSLVAESIERYRVNVLRLVPTMMKLLLDPRVGLRRRDLSSVAALHHGSAPCPAEVKRAWLDLLGPERVFESYSSQEQLGFVHIRGDEWLARPGSVGRPAPGSVVVVGEDGEEAAPGVPGRLFFRSPGAGPEYLGPAAELPVWRADYRGVGDFGYLDEDGYLYVKGRASEMINVGGANVYPAEIEDVLLSAPSVADACVVPRPHELLGQVPHALVVPAGPEAPTPAELDAHCRARLAPSKAPASYAFVAALPRNEAGKLRRADLADLADTTTVADAADTTDVTAVAGR